MTFHELLLKLRGQPLQEVRAHSDNYFEAVVSTTKLVTIEDVLMTHFGVPMKPAGTSSSAEAERFSKQYGGVRRNQTMYFRQKEKGHEVAFLWPWNCGTLVTLKIILDETASPVPESKSSGFWSFWKRLLGR